jgi:hypothetical protein
VQALVEAGWTPGQRRVELVDGWQRRLDTPGGFEIFPAARDALERYGGVEVTASGPGIECARSAFQIDPMLAIYQEPYFQRHAARLGVPLYPLGEAAFGELFLAIDPSGRVYTLFAEEVASIDPSIDVAVASFIAGVKSHALAWGLAAVEAWLHERKGAK